MRSAVHCGQSRLPSGISRLHERQSIGGPQIKLRIPVSPIASRLA